MNTWRRFSHIYRDERGFTLAEVMITVVLIGLVTAIASYTYFGVVESRAVESAGNQLASDMRLAHNSAVNQLADYRLVYDDNGDPVSCGAATADYCLVKLNSSGSPVERTPRNLPDRTEIRGTNVNPLSALVAILFPGSNRALEFNTDGSAEAVGGHAGTGADPNPTIRVGTADVDQQRRVSVTRTTSRVTNAE